MKKIVFRVDASKEIGLGHLMRCMVLSAEMMKYNVEIHFISAAMINAYRDDIIKSGFFFKLIHSDNRNHKVIDDAKHTLSYLKAIENVDLLVVDHYEIDIRWEKIVRSSAKKIVVIDDLANRKHDCDILIDQNYSANNNRYKNLLGKNTKVLLGPDYALLRSEFCTTRKRAGVADTIKSSVRRINICFGSSDIKGDTVRVLSVLKPQIQNKDVDIDIILGKHSPQINVITSWVERYKNITLYLSPSCIGSILSKADIAIGAAGTMTWERACLGIPSITLSVADNQEALANDCAIYGSHIYLGKTEEVQTSYLKAAILFLISNMSLRKSLNRKSLALVDGRGVLRVIKQLMINKVQIREAVLTDCDLIYQWRNHRINRQYSHNRDEIVYEQHKLWFDNTLCSKNKEIYIAEDSVGHVGVLRMDKQNDEQYIISVYLTPFRHGKGLAEQLLLEGLGYFKRKHKKKVKLIAEIKNDNIASIKTFEKAGFESDFSTFSLEV